jgi:hypothetical protein
MPQLPSGRHVSISPDRVYAMADQFRADLAIALAGVEKEPNGVLHFLNVVYYQPADESPTSDRPNLGNPFVSDLMASHIATDECDWSEADKKFFMEWINSDRTQQFLRSVRAEIQERFKNAEVPESLRGIMDGD